MKKMYTLILIALIIFSAHTNAQHQNAFWEPIELSSTKINNGHEEELPLKFQGFQLRDREKFENLLDLAPARFSTENQQTIIEIEIPFPDGSHEKFRIYNTPVIGAQLAAAYPRLKTFTGINGRDPNVVAKITSTPHGFFAMVLGSASGTFFLHPFNVKTNQYYSFYKKDAVNLNIPYTCETEDFDFAEKIPTTKNIANTDCQFRQYRLALACTGEYAQLADDGDDTNGDVVADVLADMVIITNIINGIFEREVGVTMVIIDRNEEIIFTDPDTDLYQNNMSTLPAENRTAMQVFIGNDAFDIGHVITDRGGGRAFVRGPCQGAKAAGASGRSRRPIDLFALNIVGHEMGHQFGGRHTHSNDCNRNETASYEPGSGSTILSYAGICRPFVESVPDDYFHAISIQQMREFITTGGSECPVFLDTENAAPTVDAGSDYIIPASTPFILEGSASDADGDSISYSWEQWDREFAVQPPSPLSTQGPSIRSFPATPDSFRYVPRLEVLRDGVANVWEVLSSVSRDLNFRLTVRANNGIYGCTSEDDMKVSVDESSGPFVINTPDSTRIWGVGELETITWDVSNSDQAPVNCANVDIYYSTDKGQTYPFLFAENVPNTGIYEFIVPEINNVSIRFMIRCAGNIFFTLSNTDIYTGDRANCEAAIMSTDVPLTITSQGTPTVESTIDIDVDRKVRTVNVVNLSGEHAFISDLEFKLISPSGTTLDLISQKCGTGSRFFLTLSDAGASLDCPINDGQIIMPENNLSGFADESALGTWTLQVVDAFDDDGGVLEAWGLEICYKEEGLVSTKNQQLESASLLLTPNPAQDQLMIAATFTEVFEGQLQIINLMGQVIHQIPVNATDRFQQKVSLMDLSDGVYFTKLTNIKGDHLTQKFVKSTF